MPACAPPTRIIRFAPPIFAAASSTGLIFPSVAGVVMMISDTPAMCAGMQFINTVDGYAAVPPGTYRPALSIGTTFCPMTIPGFSFRIKLFRF